MLKYHEAEGVCTGGTPEDFLVHYALQSNVTVEDLLAMGRIPYYCSGCDVADFPHWEMGRDIDDWFERHNEVPAPDAGS